MQISPGAHEPGVQVGEHSVPSRQKPCGQRSGAGRVHIPAASHVPRRVMFVPEQTGTPHAPPTGVGRHVPMLPARSQASQSWSQRLEQHTPSAQKPDAQSVPVPHVEPSPPGGTQVMVTPLQMRPAGQLPIVHVEAQDAPPGAQRPCGHGVGVEVAHAPAASHRPPSLSIAAPGPPVHEAVPQGVPTVRGDHAVTLRDGSHIWQRLVALTVNAP